MPGELEELAARAGEFRADQSRRSAEDERHRHARKVAAQLVDGLAALRRIDE